MVAAAVASAGCAANPRPWHDLPAPELGAELQAQDHLRDALFAQRRLALFMVAERLRLAAAPLCQRDAGTWIGILAAPAPDGNGALVLYVAPSSPAAEAGIAAGDRVLAIEGAAPRNVEALEVYPGRLAAPRLLVRPADSAERLPTLRAVEACPVPIRLLHSSRIDAQLNRDREIVVTTGMLRFVGSVDELALVVGHELGHWIRDHLARQRSDVLELEADYIGSYLAARAGYEIGGAAELWRRFAAEVLGTTDADPGMRRRMAARALSARATIEEIRQKQREGQDLLPPIR